MIALDVAALRRRLGEASRWCAQLPTDATRAQLWTPDLLDIAPASADEHALWHRLSNDPVATVTTVLERRAALLGDGSSPVARRLSGRVLVCEYGASMFDGASQTESGGLVDLWDIPAWDTWIGLVPGTKVNPAATSEYLALLSWVPASLVPRADAAVNVNPVEAVAWLDMRNRRLSRQVTARGTALRLTAARFSRRWRARGGGSEA